MVTYARFLFIRPSQLTGAGKGLFTKVFIPKNAFVVEHKGRVTTWDAVKHDIDNDYLFYVNRQHVVDAKPYAKALGRFANDAAGTRQIPGLENNCRYSVVEGKVYIKATRDIPAGSEIFVRYGNEYWEQDKKNRGV